jgi:ABC-2 type transport system permease protein
MTVGIRADQVLVSSLIYVLNESVARAVFITNHQENTTEFIKLLFERSGYVYTEINLATQDIPEDALIVISAGPKFDFLSDEIVKLERYLTAGGSVMILYDFGVRSLPALDAFLYEWGVIVENKLIFDEDHSYIPQLGVIGAHVVEGALPFTADAEAFTRNVMPLGIYLPQPLSTSWVGGVSGGFSLFPMIQTFSSSSYAKELIEGGSMTWERESGDESGPFVLAYNVRRLTRNPEGIQVFANLIVAGAGMFEDSLLGVYGDSFFNNMFITSLAGDLNQFGESVFIPSKHLHDSSMLVSSGGARNVLTWMVIVLPLAIVAAGVVVWLKRRNL